MLNYTSDFHQRQPIKARNRIPLVLSASPTCVQHVKWNCLFFLPSFPPLSLLLWSLFFPFNDDNFHKIFFLPQLNGSYLLCRLFIIMQTIWHMRIPKKAVSRCWGCTTLITMRKCCSLFLMLPKGHISDLMKTKVFKHCNRLSGSIGDSVCDVFPVAGVDTNVPGKKMLSHFLGWNVVQHR